MASHPSEIRVVHGQPTDEELAAVVTALFSRTQPAASRYEQWRRGRLAALRATPRRGV